MAGDDYTVEPGDLLYFPANCLYVIANESSSEAQILSIGVESQFGWPADSSYWLPTD
jgi:hypothetical protein